MISHLHHINFIVRDLDAAVARYATVLGLNDFIVDALDQRSVITARIKIGETWLVLVQPIGDNSEPARYLRKFGEGFFLLSFATADIDHHFAQLDTLLDTSGDLPTDNNNIDTTSCEARQGLDDWTVADLPMSAFFGAQLQLTQEGLTHKGNAT